MIALHDYWRSSASYRVRIALAMKGVGYERRPVDLLSGEQAAPANVAVNAQGFVPTLEIDGLTIGQSLAIIDYLDARFPDPALCPRDPAARAATLQRALVIAADIHPVNNLRILKYLTDVLGVTEEQKKAWYDHWVQDGLAAVERLLRAHGSSPYCFGNAPTLADCCLVPQVGNALRMGCDTSAYSRVMAVYEHCQQQAAFQQASPARQPDYAR